MLPLDATLLPFYGTLLRKEGMVHPIEATLLQKKGTLHPADEMVLAGEGPLLRRQGPFHTGDGTVDPADGPFHPELPPFHFLDETLQSRKESLLRGTGLILCSECPILFGTCRECTENDRTMEKAS